MAPVRHASTSAWRFDPPPETSTPTRSNSGTEIYTARACHNPPYDPSTFPQMLQARYRGAPIAAADNEQQSKPHVEGAEHLTDGNLPVLLDEIEQRRHAPAPADDQRPAARRQDADEVPRDSSARDVRNAVDCHVLVQRQDRTAIRPVRAEERLPQRLGKPPRNAPQGAFDAGLPIVAGGQQY